MSSASNRFSIVVPIYFNGLNIPHTVPRLQQLQELLPDFELEFIFVDDGSKDNSLELLLTEKQKDVPIQAGLLHVTGDCVGIIAADLQDPPELFVEMLNEWKSGKKVIMAVRADREESISQKLFSNSYYYFMRKLALRDYPKGGFDFVLLDRQVVEELNNIEEKNTNIMSLIFWLGHEQQFIPYVRQERKLGRSKWTFSKKIKLFVDSFVSFSYAPIRFMSLMGVVVAILSFLFGIFTIINALTGAVKIEGWTSLIAIITFLLGMIMVMLGIIGEYLWRILDESRKRPAFIIDQIYE
jgi:glycosyltransferase involved in cell wall biosynthesis